MTWKLDASAPDFMAQLARAMAMRDEQAGDISHSVKSILQDVKLRGDEAVIEYTQKWDWDGFTANHIRISEKEIRSAKKACSKDVIAALKLAAKRISSYHKKQLPKNVSYTDKQGVKLGWRWNPVDAVGLYVPGGKASYPSSVLMNAMPAKVAGVKRIVMVVPAPRGELDPAVLTAASIAGITEIYRIGGAQAVGALTYGTASIAPVDKIVGPGNAWVAEAKRQVFGLVGIDSIAGPSEICVYADNKNNPAWIAADLLSQAEHDKQAQSILIAQSGEFASKVEAEIAAQLSTLPRAEIARSSWQDHGGIIIAPETHQALAAIHFIAPEHLELAVDNPEALLSEIRHAGAIFLGRMTPEAIGDYIAGPSHVLPTSRTARFSSVLSVTDFIKRTSIIGVSEVSYGELATAGITLANAEGLGAHALSMQVRVKK
jgi:histidinol dehydrogenase